MSVKIGDRWSEINQHEKTIVVKDDVLLKFDRGEVLMEKWFNVGKIVNTHGIKGEVRVISKTDFAE